MFLVVIVFPVHQLIEHQQRQLPGESVSLIYVAKLVSSLDDQTMLPGHGIVLGSWLKLPGRALQFETTAPEMQGDGRNVECPQPEVAV